MATKYIHTKCCTGKKTVQAYMDICFIMIMLNSQTQLFMSVHLPLSYYLILLQHIAARRLK